MENEQSRELEAIRLALIDALEVRIERKDPDVDLDPISFTWDIFDYNSQFI